MNNTCGSDYKPNKNSIQAFFKSKDALFRIFLFN